MQLLSTIKSECDGLRHQNVFSMAIDGDTIVVVNRLHGVDAPELNQTFWWRANR